MKIKKYIGRDIMIAEDDSLWQITNNHNQENKLDGFDISLYTIFKNKLYREYIGLSTYNPIRKLTQNEITNYLHLIL